VPRNEDGEPARCAMVHHMVQRHEGGLDGVFAALGHPARRSIIRQLAGGGEASVSELAKPLQMSLNAIAKHLAVLAAAGLIVDCKQGRVRRCRLMPGPLRVAQAWLGDYGQFWEQQFDSLAAHLGGPATD
jgi:DNA-binding transcriptional ArsR family regulator